uniref:Chloride channel CLIC-like protein 1 n=1 Tax=Plectus sambesii TaxID=2011161 RepID=A0A914WR59_9BILA
MGLFWVAMLCIQCILSANVIHRCVPSLNPAIVWLLALLGTILPVFGLFKMYHEEKAVRTALIEQGPPISCGNSAFSRLTRFIWKDACLDYHRAVDVHVIWAVNPLAVYEKGVNAILEGILRLVSANAGKFIGIFLTSLMSALPWYFRFFVPPICIMLFYSYMLNSGFGFLWRCIEFYRPRHSLNPSPRAMELARLLENDPLESVTNASRPETGAVDIAAGSNSQD